MPLNGRRGVRAARSSTAVPNVGRAPPRNVRRNPAACQSGPHMPASPGVQRVRARIAHARISIA